ncbi:6721_t:CDS:2, partial [Gigaspora margarita]
NKFKEPSTIINLLSNNDNNNFISDQQIFLVFLNLIEFEIFEENGEKVFNISLFVAKNNNIIAQYFLDETYYYGCGTIRNQKLAINWYLKASNSECVIAYNKLGFYYENSIGKGGIEDFDQSLYCYSKANESGDKWASMKIERLFEVHKEKKKQL